MLSFLGHGVSVCVPFLHGSGSRAKTPPAKETAFPVHLEECGEGGGEEGNQGLYCQGAGKWKVLVSGAHACNATH